MKTKYHICLVIPSNYIHSMAFKEIALLLINSFASLGNPCTFKVNQFCPEAINIILGYHLLTDLEPLKNIKYIPYQLEQLNAVEGWFSEQVKRTLSNAYDVWDYAKENIIFLEKIGIKSKYLPIGYHPSLEIIKPTTRDIDVLFYGSINERRQKILEELRKNKLRVEVITGVYGEKRDQYIARAKINLNIHYYADTRIFEAVRISYLLNNKCFVLSETSLGNPYPKVNLSQVDYPDLVKTCLNYLQNEKVLNELAEEAYHSFKSYDMVSFLREVLS